MIDFAAVRAELAAALTAVDGVTGHTRRPDPPADGDAWPMWRGASFDDGVPGVAAMVQWAVLVVLPGDEASADEWVAEHVAELLDALLPYAYVVSFEPVKITTDAGDRYGLMINLRRE